MASVPRLRSCPWRAQVAQVSAMLPHVLGGVDEHAAGACRRVADAHPLFRLEQLNNEAHHGSGSVEFAALLAGVVGELVDQVLVGIAKDVAAPCCVDSQVLVAQVQGRRSG